MREEAQNSDPVKAREIWAKIDNRVEVSEGIPLFVKIPVKNKYGPLSIHCIVSTSNGDKIPVEGKATYTGNKFGVVTQEVGGHIDLKMFFAVKTDMPRGNNCCMDVDVSMMRRFTLRYAPQPILEDYEKK